MFVIYFKFKCNWFHIHRVIVKKRCPKAMKRTISSKLSHWMQLVMTEMFLQNWYAFQKFPGFSCNLFNILVYLFFQSHDATNSSRPRPSGSHFLRVITIVSYTIKTLNMSPLILPNLPDHCHVTINTETDDKLRQ